MFELDIQSLKEQGLQLVDSAKKTAIDLAGKGKSQLDLINLQSRMSKAERQLGALVYSLHKSGEENQPLIDKYIESIAELEKAIEDIKAQEAVERTVETEEAPEEEEVLTPAEEKLEEELQEVAEELDALSSEFEEAVIEEEPIRPRGDVKVCPVCSAEIDAEALFCTHCGAQL